jgi:hypothetical protein
MKGEGVVIDLDAVSQDRLTTYNHRIAQEVRLSGSPEE